MLTEEDCIEIACALSSKVISLERGDYGGDEENPGETEEWIAHLKGIMDKIGPDGVTLFAYCSRADDTSRCMRLGSGGLRGEP